MADYDKVGLLVVRDGRILLCRKKHTTSLLILPGGCREAGESSAGCLLREIHEELGVQAQIDFIIGTLHFHRGEATPENEMVGVQFCCSIEDPGAIRTSWEHVAHCWVTAEEAGVLLPADHWLLQVIQRAEAMRALMPRELLAYYRTAGWMA